MLTAKVQRTLAGFSLDVEVSAANGMLGLLGESGSGKSMTMRSIAGIDTPDGGKITLNGRDLFDVSSRINLRPQKRRVGYLFQNYALFPNMTVSENIGCATPRAQRETKSGALMERFGLMEFKRRYPSELSSGQQQRVAMARCLASEPEALLLDEPFSALDEHLRQQMRLQVLGVLKQLDIPVVLVTHNREEAYQMCDHLIVLEGGRVVGEGETRQLFQDPGTVGAARILGVSNLSPAQVLDDGRVLAGDWGLELKVEREIPSDMVELGIRAHELRVSTGENDLNRFAVEVVDRFETPGETCFLLKKKGAPGMRPLLCALRGETSKAPEYLCVDPAHVLMLRR